ncbi:hypothetical protein NDI37_16125 [Funiculus sociatus GB2-A5]|uniref:Uncharacterized protein n=1 Tax=Funiculus sociatus GB2-A5 TaxID=2933946 RepID=A0ABV0JRH9_9CYAN|nr:MULTISPECIES: hypothetical protein [unclassified Trichocoleus]MBD1906147.1 hypothetical protein [Trichocoleus sp. FACHB-832]MBD2061231.1 hypothetical protein [Trichocoleus sp. FACHB-6]
MRYLLLIFVSSFLSLLSGRVVTASEIQTPNLVKQNSLRSTSAQSFWPEAQRLVQDQINLINRIERAIASDDPYGVFVAEGKITLHQGEVERFLKNQYRNPALLCTRTNGGITPAGSDLSVEQAQVYCSLYASTAQLMPLRPVLERRQATLTPNNPLTLSRSQQSILAVPPQKLPSPPTSYVAPEPPLVGIRAKTPISGYQPPIAPAIAPPQQATTGLASAKQLLSQAVASFPPATPFIDAGETAKLKESNAYGLNQQEPQEYGNFLSQPNTGIARVLPSGIVNSQPMQNRLIPTVAERFAYPPLLRGIGGDIAETTRSSGRISQEDEFTPRFAVKLENGNFQIAQRGLDYGFMMDLGEVPLENLDPTLKKVRALSPQTRQFFLNYRPPNELAALQVDRQRFITGKLGEVSVSEPVQQTTALESAINPLSPDAPVVLNHTYLMRLVQFQVPEVVLNRGTVNREQRRYLDQILETPSSDALVAFRPVNRRPDGSYTVLWRVLNQFPDPQIEDLEKYVNLQ